MGIIPGGGGTQRLARAIGKQGAMEHALTGRRAPCSPRSKEGPAAGLRTERALFAGENVFAGPAMARRAGYVYGARPGRGAGGQIGTGLGQTTSLGTCA